MIISSHTEYRSLCTSIVIRGCVRRESRFLPFYGKRGIAAGSGGQRLVVESAAVFYVNVGFLGALDTNTSAAGVFGLHDLDMSEPAAVNL